MLCTDSSVRLPYTGPGGTRRGQASDVNFPSAGSRMTGASTGQSGFTPANALRRFGALMSATLIPDLRSPYDPVGGIVHFGRMLDKIRLHAKGELPPLWAAAKGVTRGFDQRCCSFLKVDYSALEARVIQGGTDEEILEWAFAEGRKPSEEEIEVWNGFMMKLGWRDATAERVRIRLAESGFPEGAVLTMFDFIDLDEGRPVRWG